MPLPKKAIYKGQLKIVTDGALTPSGHEVVKVEFVDVNGIKKTGFYKKLANNYSQTLAMYCVGFSVDMRLAIGNRVAEERLVFDEEDKIVGTLSFALPDFKPLIESVSCLELLKGNFVEILAALLWGKADDSHPYNVGLAGFFDLDMFHYDITHIMNGGRLLIDGYLRDLPKKAMSFKSCQFDNFPNIEGRTHWPANIRPLNANLYKCYHADTVEAIRQLAMNPSFQLGDQTVSFQQQFFSALLKKLMTFDTDMLRVHLEDYLGDLPLNYHSLDSDKVKKLEQEYPDLFNKNTNNDSFVSHIVRVLEQEHNEFYQLTVSYPGCKKNDKGVSVMGFGYFLSTMPQEYLKIKQWADKQNQKMRECWESQKEKKQDVTNKANWPIVDAYCVAPKGYYNLKKMEQHYYNNIWLTAHTPNLAIILTDLIQLKEELAEKRQEVSLSPKNNKEKIKNDDSSLEDSWQIFNTEKKTLYVSKNQVRESCYQLNILIQKIRNYACSYSAWEQKDTGRPSTRYYLEGLEKLIAQDVKIIESVLTQDKETAFQFNEIIHKLNSYIKDLVPKNIPLKKRFEHTDTAIVETCLEALFLWINQYFEKEALVAYIEGIIVSLYKGRRSEKVKGYLKAFTNKEDNATCLALILSEGGCEDNSLNTLLVERMIALMVLDMMRQERRDPIHYMHFLSVHFACQTGKFDKKLFSKSAQNRVLNNVNFTHLYSKNNIELFYKCMYSWINTLVREKFQSIVEEVLSSYEPSLLFSFLSPRVRAPLVRDYFQSEKYKERSNAYILALIFSEKNGESALNRELFKKILELMKSMVNANDPVFEKVLKYMHIESKNYPAIKIKTRQVVSQIDEKSAPFLNSLSHYAKLVLKESDELQPNTVSSSGLEVARCQL
ncbi:hypothetical protein [Legionella fairfieldensis]|uniref:hypothetical protein n=1 Tax=Legionella fairfieldensis TaxID=45064 RepID=UPI00048F9275|nr:hypothetical protein [Legionella fairfieldensis]